MFRFGNVLSQFRSCVDSAARFSTNTCLSSSQSYKLVVLGGGAGGCAVANIFSRRLQQKNSVAIIEPRETHYYQPGWTFVGGGVMSVEQTARPMNALFPRKADWIKDHVVKFDPKQNKVFTQDGREINYEYLVVALGIQLDYNKIRNCLEAMQSDPTVCSNYHVDYVRKTFKAIQNFKGGNAIFTFPNTPIKCAGAPQKIMYLAEHYFRKHGVRDQTKVIFNTSLGVIFGVQKYADALLKVIAKRDIAVNFKRNLVEIRPQTKEAVFDKLDKPGETETFKYDLLHVTPPMSSPQVLRESPLAASEGGWLDVDKFTLQHKKFPNVFGIGDCTNVPTSKTAAAAAAQCGILKANLLSQMEGKPLTRSYDGYTSCPLITGYGSTILAEFDFNAQPLETFPFDQGKERRTMYHVKKDFMPPLYWHLMLSGHWEGPGLFRKSLRLGFGK